MFPSEFENLGLLGQGASAQVYRAKSKGGNRLIALKVFHSNLLSEPPLLKRMELEIETLKRLKNEFTVELIDSKISDQQAWIAFEYLSEGTLEQFQKKIPYVLPELCILILCDVLKSLEEAHQKEILHRDLKPSNVLISKEGVIKVADFGLAKLSDFSSMTLSGAVIGSPDFMSPEQAKGEVLDHRSDLFSAASILYFLVTGTRPFRRESTLATLSAVASGDFELPQKRNPKLSLTFSQILSRALSREREKRYGSAREFREALENYLTSVGLNGEWFAFSDFLANPNECVWRALHKTAETISNRIENQLATGDLEDSLKSISHFSLVAPDSERLSFFLKRHDEVKRKRQTRKKVWAWALLTILFGAFTFAFYGFKRQESEVEAHSASAAPVVPLVDSVVPTPTPQLQAELLQAQAPPDPLTAQLPDATKTEQATAVVLERERTGAPKKLSRQRLASTERKVSFKTPSDVQIFWDGKEIDPSKGLVSRVGKHRLKMIKGGFAPIEQTVQVEENQPNVIQVYGE